LSNLRCKKGEDQGRPIKGGGSEKGEGTHEFSGSSSSTAEKKYCKSSKRREIRYGMLLCGGEEGGEDREDRRGLIEP